MTPSRWLARSGYNAHEYFFVWFVFFLHCCQYHGMERGGPFFRAKVGSKLAHVWGHVCLVCVGDPFAGTSRGTEMMCGGRSGWICAGNAPQVSQQTRGFWPALYFVQKGDRKLRPLFTHLAGHYVFAICTQHVAGVKCMCKGQFVQIGALQLLQSIELYKLYNMQWNNFLICGSKYL